MKNPHNQPGSVEELDKRSQALAAGDSPRLRLVACKDHRRPISKNCLFEKVVEKRSRFLLPSADAILIRRFSTGRIVFWNPGAQRLYGWSKKAAMGKVAFKLLATKLPEPPQKIKTKLRRHGCWAGKLIQTTRHGKTIAVKSYWSLRQSPGDGPMEILEVNYPVTNATHSEARESDRLALVGTMAAVFGHEVASPLSGISASLQFVESDLKRKQFDIFPLLATIQGALREVDRLVSLLNEFRSLALPPNLNLRASDLQELIEEVLASEEIAYRNAGITVKTDFAMGLTPVKLDCPKMKQAVLNLCKNAAEAMRRGGCLTVKLYRSAGRVVLEIGDNGIGVPPGVNIFELFKTTKRNGSGLGLSVVQQIVAAHSGTVGYTTEAGRGTTFQVSLPA